MVTVTSKTGEKLADAAKTESVDGNHYFPPSSVNKEFFKDSATRTTCGFKGVAHYYDLHAGGAVVKDVAWYYPEPKSGMAKIKDHVAFYKTKVQIS